jgi:hypothetical protein
MALLHLALASAALFALLHWWLVPRSRVRPGAAASESRAATTAALEALRSIALIAACSAALVSVAALAINLRGGADVDELRHLLGYTAQWRERAHRWSSWWGAGATALIILALVVSVRRSARVRSREEEALHVQRELDRLREELASGQWESLPATQAMEQLQADVGKLHELREQVSSMEGMDDSQREQTLASINREIAIRERLFMNLDLARRIEPRTEPETAIPPRGVAEKVSAFFVSQGLLKSTQGGSRALLIVALLLLVPSLLSVQGMSLASALDRRVVALRELVVTATIREEEAARSEVSKLPSVPPSAAQNSEEPSDSDVMDSVSAAYEDAVARHAVWKKYARTPSTAAQRSARTRDEILVEFAQARPDVEVVGGVEEQAARAEKRSEKVGLWATESMDSSARGPRTEVGRAFRDELSAISKKHPERWTRIRTGARAWAASFQVPATRSDLQTMALLRIFGSAADGVDSPGPIAEAAKDLLKAVGDGPLKDFSNYLRGTFLAQVSEGATPEQISARMEMDDIGWHGSAFENLTQIENELPKSNALEQLDPRAPGVIERRSSEELQAMAEASEALDRLAAADVSGRPRQDDILLDYETLFPSTPDAPAGRDDRSPGFATDSDSDHGPGNGRAPPHEPSDLPPFGIDPGTPPDFPGGPSPGGGGIGSPSSPSHPSPRPGGGLASQFPGGGPSPTKSYPAPSASRSTPSRISGPSRGSYAMSRSFARLRGFSRIGGVLIGAPADHVEASTDFRALRWEAARSGDGDLNLFLKRADAQELRVGPFPKRIVHAALAYVADGRPITVTMISAPPLDDLKILLHPVLLDTPLGCNAIELDSLVDKYTAGDPMRQIAHMEVEMQSHLYSHTWMVWLASVGPSLLEQLAADDASFIHALLTNVRTALASPVQSMMSEKALQLVQASGRLANSIVVVKKDYYHPQVASWLQRCQREHGLAEFDRCVVAASPSSEDVLRSRELQNAILPPPRFQVWSGVREKSFSVDKNLVFVAPPPSSALDVASRWDDLPVRFMLQAAFVTPPRDSQTAEPSGDEQPWEFRDLSIEEHVRAGVAKNPRDQELLLAMWQFTSLQRLFRAALEGQLGPQFPVGELARLTKATRTDQNPGKARTPRWLPHEPREDPFRVGSLSEIKALRAKLDPVGSMARSTCKLANH